MKPPKCYEMKSSTKSIFVKYEENSPLTTRSFSLGCKGDNGCCNDRGCCANQGCCEYRPFP
jgi:hypothetical protein